MIGTNTMKINIYYGGRGLLEDPTIYIMKKIMEVFNDLRVEVNRYNLYEEKSRITTLPNTLKDADGVVLVTNVEWYGIGGYMQQFLDACWYYGDKEKIESLYMMPVVTSVTYGEREAENTLIQSWNMLGGKCHTGICAYVEEQVEFETNPDYMRIIENRSEDLYRVVNKRMCVLPNSRNVMNQANLMNKTIEFSPQESEQLSMFVSNDEYVKKQKEDIQELSSLFREMLGEKKNDEEEVLEHFKNAFVPGIEDEVSYAITFKDLNKTMILELHNKTLECYYGEKEDADVKAKVSSSIMNKIIAGEMNFQKGFMTGEITAKGNFKILRSFDQIFCFQ